MRAQETAAVLDAVYDLGAPSTDAWLDGLVSALRRFDRGRLATAAGTYELDPDGWRLGAMRGIPASLESFCREHVNATPGATKRLWIQQHDKHGSFQQTIARIDPKVARWWWAAPLTASSDFLYTQCLDGGDEMVLLARPMLGRATTTGPRTRLAGALAAHVATGNRLRRSLAGARLLAEQGEAVIDPSGRVVHARGQGKSLDARTALRDAVLSRDRARTRRAATDLSAPLELWSALVSGRWTLVDFFDTDLRRYHVAVANDPVFTRASALSMRERQMAMMAGQGMSNAAMAYALGIAPSAVTRALAGAITKLRLRRRTDLPWVIASSHRAFAVETAGVVAFGTDWDEGVAQRLTPALRVVARAVVDGASDDDIARARGVSARTVANQVGRIFDVLGVSGRVELVRALVRRDER